MFHYTTISAIFILFMSSIFINHISIDVFNMRDKESGGRSGGQLKISAGAQVSRDLLQRFLSYLIISNTSYGGKLKP